MSANRRVETAVLLIQFLHFRQRTQSCAALDKIQRSVIDTNSCIRTAAIGLPWSTTHSHRQARPSGELDTHCDGPARTPRRGRLSPSSRLVNVLNKGRVLYHHLSSTAARRRVAAEPQGKPAGNAIPPPTHLFHCLIQALAPRGDQPSNDLGILMIWENTGTRVRHPRPQQRPWAGMDTEHTCSNLACSNSTRALAARTLPLTPPQNATKR